NRSAMSDGLIGAASILTITSSGAGSSKMVGSSESVSSPSATVERSCSPSRAISISPVGGSVLQDALDPGVDLGQLLLHRPRDGGIVDDDVVEIGPQARRQDAWPAQGSGEEPVEIGHP